MHSRSPTTLYHHSAGGLGLPAPVSGIRELNDAQLDAGLPTNKSVEVGDLGLIAYVSDCRRNDGRGWARPGDQTQCSCQAARCRSNNRPAVDPRRTPTCPQNSARRRPLPSTARGRRGSAPATAVQARCAGAQTTIPGGPTAALTLHVDNRRRDRNTRDAPRAKGWRAGALEVITDAQDTPTPLLVHHAVGRPSRERGLT
jgi:hypothetical protein